MGCASAHLCNTYNVPTVADEVRARPMVIATVVIALNWPRVGLRIQLPIWSAGVAGQVLNSMRAVRPLREATRRK